MRQWLQTYTAYSIACAIVWAALIAGAVLKGHGASQPAGLVCAGWWFGPCAKATPGSSYHHIFVLTMTGSPGNGWT
jgi:hypothetical protein